MKIPSVVDMSGWQKALVSFGTLEIWRKGNQRRLIDPQTGEVVASYEMEKEETWNKQQNLRAWELAEKL